MSEESRPSRPVRRKPLPTESESAESPKAKPAAAKPALPRPVQLKTKVARVKAPTEADAAADGDEFVAPAARRVPPQVLGKKKKKSRSGLSPEEAAFNAAAADKPRSEFLIPLILIGVGLVANVLVSMFIRDEGMPLGLWLGVRMAIIVVSMVITYGALFVCAAVLDADYGYLDVGAVKVAAICLTQGWVGDLVGEIPVPFIGSLIAFLVSWFMFKGFFELGDAEVWYSMIIVRLIHWLVVAFLFVLLMTAILNSKDISVPGFNDAQDAVMEPEDAADFDDAGGAEGLDDPREMEP
jgi:hypothetical protein